MIEKYNLVIVGSESLLACYEIYCALYEYSKESILEVMLQVSRLKCMKGYTFKFMSLQTDQLQSVRWCRLFLAKEANTSTNFDAVKEAIVGALLAKFKFSASIPSGYVGIPIRQNYQRIEMVILRICPDSSDWLLSV